MTTVKLHVESTIGPTTDVGAMWKAAVDRYEDTTKFKIQSLAGAISVDEILGQIHERETKFTTHRHDGSKLDKFRTLVRNSLVPIAMLGDIVAKATKTVRNLPLPALNWQKLTSGTNSFTLPPKLSLRLSVTLLVYDTCVLIPSRC